MKDVLRVKGAREHNLKNIDIELPKHKLITITGLSGSGKSTLAFDTIYAEGQRRYVESLSAYARQFLGLMQKPDVDSIEGLSPAISIEQKTTHNNPRSTVGTVTEIYDYLRLLYARVGTQYCPVCDKEVSPQSAQTVAQNVFKLYQGKKCIVYAPIVRQKKGTYEQLYKDYHKKGITKAYTNGQVHDITEIPKLERYEKHDIYIQIDRMVLKDDKDVLSRLNEATETAMKEGDHMVIVDIDGEHHLFSGKLGCVDHPEISFEELQPRMFSFNSPLGACPQCHGLGVVETFDPDMLVPDKSLSIAEGAIKVFRNHVDGWRTRYIAQVAKKEGIDIMTPWEDLEPEEQNFILYGDGNTSAPVKKVSRYRRKRWATTDYEAVIPLLQRLYVETESDYRRENLRKFMTASKCDACDGKRLKPQSLAVRIANKNIIEVTDMSIADATKFFEKLTLTKQQMNIAKEVLKEIRGRLKFLYDVGLGYLTLSRSAGTLSGGEAQRIRLATQIGSNLTGVLYVLDEPSIGLHQRDNVKLIETLKKLRDIGNTVLVIEHDEETMLESDFLVDIGPGAGVHGGQIVASGTPKQVMANKNSVTGQYLAGKLHIPPPDNRRQPNGKMVLKGATENNLKDVTVNLPKGVLCVITGVSGSGKSTLLNDTFAPALMNKVNKAAHKTGKYKSLLGSEKVDKVIVIDQSPIGRTPRSNPATYTNLFTDIRNLFASTQEAKARGYQPGRFSFNVKGGRCETCQGDGMIKIEMNFLPDVYVPCEACNGKRYNDETLQVLYKNKSISDVLDMTVEEASTFFEKVPSIHNKVKTLQEVGLGYIKLGQSSTTLSGGEAQRIKLTSELAKRSTGKTVYILDEPTTGLHFDDVAKLLEVLQRLVDKGNSVYVIEHNLDVIKSADHIIDIGPEGGDGGGTIVAEGTPEEVANNKHSYTGQFLKKALGN